MSEGSQVSFGNQCMSLALLTLFTGTNNRYQWQENVVFVKIPRPTGPSIDMFVLIFKYFHFKFQIWT